MARFEHTACELCGDETEARALVKHYVIPKDLMEQARMRRARIVRVCPRCQGELENWNRAKIDRNTFDPQIKKFRQRLPVELVKEYENAYNRFEKFKKNQHLPV